jgi:hypothetical protein
MAKFYGKIGYIKTVETDPGIWEEKVTEHTYYGDVTRNTSRWQQQSNSVNDDLNINNIISIVADPYANENFQHMKYVEWMGAKWKITNAEVQFPRIILTLGGVYHENSSGSSD